MNTKKTISSVLAIILVIAALFGLNTVTGPVIEQNAASSLLGPLVEVLPGSSNFNEIVAENLPEAITAIYEETSGLGYSLKLYTVKGYTGSPIECALGVSADGKITGLQVTEYPDTKDVTPEFIASFNDADSALAGVDLVSGATYSSSAIKGAVSDALNYMADNGMIKAGVKSDSQVFAEMISSVFPGFANAAGIVQMTEDSTDDLMIAPNGTGAAAIAAIDGANYLQIKNINGDVKTFDLEGKEVDKAECDALAAQVFASTADKDEKKIAALCGDGATLEEIPLANVYNCVTSAFKVTCSDGTYYGFGTRPYAYSNELMPVYFILDENGAIAQLSAPDFILYGEYFKDYQLDKDAYKAGFEGLDQGSYADDVSIIAGATMSSDAVNMATKAVFEAFAILGGAQ